MTRTILLPALRYAAYSLTGLLLATALLVRFGDPAGRVLLTVGARLCVIGGGHPLLEAHDAEQLIDAYAERRLVELVAQVLPRPVVVAGRGR